MRAATALTESQFQQQITDLADLYGWRWYHTHDARRSVAGFPDLVMVKGFRLVIAELKQDGEYPNREQRAWLAALRGVPGITVRCWQPSDWQEIEALLTAAMPH